MQNSTTNVRKLTGTAMLGAVAAVLMYLEFPIPSWAGLVTVPLYSRANGVFQGIHVRMVWSRSGTNPSIRLLAALARQLIQNKEEARL